MSHLHPRCPTCIRDALPASNMLNLHPRCSTCIRDVPPASEMFYLHPRCSTCIRDALYLHPRCSIPASEMFHLHPRCSICIRDVPPASEMFYLHPRCSIPASEMLYLHREVCSNLEKIMFLWNFYPATNITSYPNCNGTDPHTKQGPVLYGRSQMFVRHSLLDLGFIILEDQTVCFYHYLQCGAE